MKIKKINLKIGDYQICPIPTGIFSLDGGAMFGTVPKVLWEKSNPADDKNRIPMEARALLLKSDKMNILIDTGNGADFVLKFGDRVGAKFAQMYNISDEGASLLKSLDSFGVKPEDVDAVILTHLHFDHAGGATTAKDGVLVPTFPKAKYYLQKKNLENAQAPNMRERASYYSANYQPLLDAGLLVLVDGDQEILPQVSVITSHGHTDGQQIVKVSDGKQSLYYCADLIPTSSHVRLPWVMGYDMNPLLLMEEKDKVLKQAAIEKAYLYFEHDPYCDCAQIQKTEKDYEVVQRFHL